MSSFRFLDVSGVGHSGKSAITDLLREVEGVFVPHFQFEFDLLRVPGGLLDLRHRVLTDWSPVRSHAAIHAFRDVVNKMGRNPHWWDLAGLAKSTSQRYDRAFRGHFTKLSEEFVSSLVVAEYAAEWPYDDLRIGSALRLARKILRRVGFRNKLRRNVCLVHSTKFDARAAEYLSGLYSAIVPSETEFVVFNNGLEPFNPIPGLDMLAGAGQIVVTRDPRDVYVSGLNATNVAGDDRALIAFDNDGLNKSFLATDDLQLFVKRLRIYYSRLFMGSDPRVLRVRFEELVTDYDRTVARLLGFLKIDPTRHSSPRVHFRPEISAAGVGLWRRYSKKDELRYIEQELGELLVDG